MTRERPMGEPTLQRMILRLAVVVGLLLISVQLAVITRVTPQNTISLLALGAIPAFGLFTIESLFQRRAARTSNKETSPNSSPGVHHAAR